MGSTADFMLESVRVQEIIKVLGSILSTDTVLCADGGIALAAAARHLEFEHHPINLSANVRVQGSHVQNVNAFCSRLARMDNPPQGCCHEIPHQLPRMV